MKNIVLALGLVTSLIVSCNDQSNSVSTQPTSDTSSTQKQVAVADTNGKVIKDTMQKQQANGELAGKLFGTWAQVGMENAAFVIEKKKITYPETFKSYKYSLLSDSIKIKYDDYTGSYAVKMRGADTLVLTGDEETVYYRVKK